MTPQGEAWTAENIFRQVRTMVAETYREDIASIHPDTRFVADLGDSMEMVEVVMDCEEMFGIAIPDAEAERLETVGALAAYIERRLRERGHQA